MSGVGSQEPSSAPARRRRTLAFALLAAVLVWACAAFVLPLRGSGTAPGDAQGEQATTAEAPAPPEDAGPPTTEAPPAAPLPACGYGDEPAPYAGVHEWRHTLLDTTFRLDADYVPDDLVELQAALAHLAPGEVMAAAGHRLRRSAANDLVALFQAAEAAGVQLAVQSAYRSYEYQASTFQYWTDLEGREEALRTSARAGHSEHQLGTSVDLRSRHGPPAWDLEDWATTPEGAWVMDHAHHYGFVLSYPEGEEHRSCYAYEPWHYRYLGRELAEEIHATGDPPRVYLWQHAQVTNALAGGDGL